MDAILDIGLIAMLGIVFVVFALILTREKRDRSSRRGGTDTTDSGFWSWFSSGTESQHSSHHHSSHHHHDSGGHHSGHHGGFDGGHHGGFDGGGFGGGHH